MAPHCITDRRPEVCKIPELWDTSADVLRTRYSGREIVVDGLSNS